MLGYLRFFLAFLVLLSHVEVRFFGLNPGVIAVVIFYILAGHVVARLWKKIIPDGPGKLYAFYRDRALRILPLYFYIAVLTLFFLIVTGYGSPRFTLSGLLNNVLIIPLNYYMYMDSTILTTPAWCLIPPAWSLGAELQAYILLPAVLSYAPLKPLLAIASFTVYLLANFSFIHPDYFGYRLIAGVFFIFMAGSSLQATENKACIDVFDRFYPWILWAVIAALSLFFWWKNGYRSGYTRETFLGLLVGIPMVYHMNSSSLKLPGNALMGSLSYGIFLVHFLIIWWLDHTGYMSPAHGAYIPAVTLGSLILSGVGMVILERHVDTIRKKKKFSPETVFFS